MSFFLLGRLPDNELRLLSSVGHQNRQAALAELSRLTADPSFDLWDAEVFVVDLETATPVLLVRPVEMPSPAEKPAPAVEEVAEEVADVGVAEAEPEAEVPAEEPEAAAKELEAGEPTEELRVEEPEPIVVDEAVVDEIIAEAIAEESAEAGTSLKDALMRTAAHMESTGIVAPESVGPATDVVEPEAQIEEPEAQAEPEELVEAETPSAEPAPVVEEPVAAGEAAWPWAVAAADVSMPSLSALEEPAIDVEGGLLRGSIDDETFAAARPVILGAYAGEGQDEAAPVAPIELEELAVEESAQPEAVEIIETTAIAQDEIAPAAPIAEVEAAPEPAIDSMIADLEPIELEEVQTAPAPEPAVEPAPATEVDDISDFILDLEASVSGPVPGPAGTPEAPGVESMTCNDCVYVATCPNKDQRDPANCGSFQWK